MSGEPKQRGIHLVGLDRSGGERLAHGDLYADIIPDRVNSNIWFYVVQRQSSPEILALGTCTSADTARTIATRSMKDLSLGASAASSSSSG